MKVYKLTDQNMRTHGGFQWVQGEKRTTSGAGNLCGPGWLHAYSSPLVALLHNSRHAAFDNPRLFEAEAAGEYRNDRGMKCGHTELTLGAELPLPVVTNKQCACYAILCALEVGDPSGEWVAWALHYVDGSDESRDAAYAAYAAADAAYAAAAAAYAAADAAADAAYAAEIDFPRLAEEAMELGK